MIQTGSAIPCSTHSAPVPSRTYCSGFTSIPSCSSVSQIDNKREAITSALFTINEEARANGIQPTRYKIEFSSAVSLHTGRSRTFTRTARVGLFVSSNGKLCYYTRKNARNGRAFPNEALACLTSISVVLPGEQRDSELEKVRSLANRFHPNAWADLREKLSSNPDKYYSEYGYTVTNIVGKFPALVIEQVREAFNNNTDFSFRKHSNGKQGRDLKIECKQCDDGVYRAWFTSYFPGCLNGDFWLLCNPTTAIFKERD